MYILYAILERFFSAKVPPSVRRFCIPEFLMKSLPICRKNLCQKTRDSGKKPSDERETESHYIPREEMYNLNNCLEP